MFTLNRTLSVDQTNDDSKAKDNYLSQKRQELTSLHAQGDISSELLSEISLAINQYIQFNCAQTRQGFERGLTTLITNLLHNTERLENRIEL